jgi:adenylate cyclase
MKTFGNYRRDLAVLDTTGGRIPQIQHNPPTAASPIQVPPWMSSNGSPGVPLSVFSSSFYNDYDSGDNLSQSSQLSPGFRPGTGRKGNN